MDRGGKACERTASWFPIFTTERSQVDKDGGGENENVEGSRLEGV